MKMLKYSAVLRKCKVQILDKSWIILRYWERINTCPMQKNLLIWRKKD